MLTYENMPFIIYFRNIEKMSHHMCPRLLLTIRDVKLKNTADRPPSSKQAKPTVDAHTKSSNILLNVSSNPSI